MYIPRASMHQRFLEKYHREHLIQYSGSETFSTPDVPCYDFLSYDGNLEAIRDMLAFRNYSPQMMTLTDQTNEGFVSINWWAEHTSRPHPHFLIKASWIDGKEFYVELRHPRHGRSKLLYRFQAFITGAGNSYFIADSFPDFHEQFMNYCLHSLT